MNLFRRSSVLEKLYKIIDNRSITASSIARWKDGPLPASGLQTRLLNYLERSYDRNDNEKSSDGRELYLPTSLKSATCLSSDSTGKTTGSAHDHLIESLLRQFSLSRGSTTKHYVQLVDKQCLRLLGESSKSEIFRLLHLLTKNLPNELTSMRYYKNALLTLRKMLELGRLDKQETMQLLFFESWNKKLAVRNVKFVMDSLPPLRELSLMEQSIFAQSAYQCSIGLKTEDVRVLQEAIETNASDLVNDTAILSTLCKAIRRAGPTNDLSLTNLSGAIVAKVGLLDLMCAAHVSSLYAEAGLDCPDVLQRLFDDAMIIVSMNRQRKIKARVKDVDRLLWAAAAMNYKLRESDIHEISLFVDRNLRELTKEPFYFANILLSLWILNSRPTTFLKMFLRNGLFRPIVTEGKLWKPKARLHLLLSCARIETPEIALPNELAHEYVVGLKVSQPVRRLRGIVTRLTSEMEIDEVAIGCPVNGLYIAGVSLRHGNISLHVDLLNDSTCFRGTVVPRGLMNLKLRLLPKIGVQSILVNPLPGSFFFFFCNAQSIVF